jgi:hypothetical protein
MRRRRSSSAACFAWNVNGRIDALSDAERCLAGVELAEASVLAPDAGAATA